MDNRPKRNRYTYSKFPERVTFRLSSRHMEELNELADVEGVTRSVLVRHLVVKYLESKREHVVIAGGLT